MQSRIGLTLLPLLVIVTLSSTSTLLTVDGQTPTPPYQYETRWWTAQLDNFNFGFTGQSFQLKYLISTEYYKEGGPIFIYTGNEGPIELFAENTGFMWEIAPEFGAMIVFAEHRYYGASLPFGDSTFSHGYQHLSAEQALADYSLLLTSLKHNMSIPNAKVISFGGSYGGMLTAWFRKTYPHIIAGGIAGSAPIWFFNTLASEFDAGSYNRIASNDFKQVSQECFDNIAASWDALNTVAAQPNGLKILSQMLGLCTELTSMDDVPNQLYPWLSNVYSSMPMGDYPYPASFIAPLPGYPVNVTCGYFSKKSMTPIELVTGSRQVVDLFYNFTGQAGSCHNLTDEQGLASLGASNSWPVQSCQEMIMPIGQYGPPNDLFYLAPWNLTADLEQCQQEYGITGNPYWIMTHYGGPQDWDDATNIVFSNGSKDPWQSGGVLKNISETVIALPVIGGAHHSDLRASDPRDPEGVKWARQQEKYWIQRFLDNPTPANPPQKIVYLPTEESGLTKTQLIVVCCCGTFGGCLVGLFFYLWCCARKPTVTERGHTQEGYNAMNA